jgi:hypothetical protein
MNFAGYHVEIKKIYSTVVTYMKVSMFYVTETITALLLLGSILVTAFGNNITDTFAQGLTSPLDEAEKLLSDIQSLMNQSGGTDPADFSASSDLAANNSDFDLAANNSDFGLEDPGRKDLSGHYSNLKFGIVDFVIPSGWFASENIEGEKLISVDIQEGTTKERLDKLVNEPIDLNSSTITPKITLTSYDKEESKQADLLLEKFSAGSIIKTCNNLESNSTAEIDGKPFKVSTMECKSYAKSDESATQNPQDSISTDVIKKYEYETPDTTFSVELTLPTQDYYSTVHKSVDITKYTPILEPAASSLKLK